MFTIQFARPANLRALLAKAAKDADENGIQWTGDAREGHGTGHGFEGRYEIDANYITVHVLKKPLYATRAKIEKAVKQYLQET